VFEDFVVKRIFGPKTGVTRGWRKLHNEELHNLYSSQNTIRVIKSRRIGWVGHVACIREMSSVYWILGGKSEGNNLLGKIILKWKLKK
jgi:hypothetical protein